MIPRVNCYRSFFGRIENTKKTELQGRILSNISFVFFVVSKKMFLRFTDLFAYKIRQKFTFLLALESSKTKSMLESNKNQDYGYAKMFISKEVPMTCPVLTINIIKLIKYYRQKWVHRKSQVISEGNCGIFSKKSYFCPSI